MKPKTIKDRHELSKIARRLRSCDPVLASIFERLGAPPLWNRKPGLPTLVLIVLEQQVSLASGRASYAKLKRSCGNQVNAKRIIALGEKGLRDDARLTRQKACYIYELAMTCQQRKLNLMAIELLDDEQARQQLMMIKGIGLWTADVYLLAALCRIDILPMGDLALELEIAELCKLDERPSRQWLLKRAERWRPHRSTAARMIWHSYLDRLGRHDET